MTKDQRAKWIGYLAVPTSTLCVLAWFTGPAHAAPGDEISILVSTLYILLHGALVLWMAAGFAMLESGLVRTKSVSTILLKNITVVAIASVAFMLLGYNLMYDGVDGGLVGSLKPWTFPKAVYGDARSTGLVPGAHWFFQMVFVATAASIVSGTVAERVKLWPFFAFVFALTAVIYPIAGAWHWGGGWLAKLGFVDFAGSTIVHSVGGWAALTGAIVLGARRGKYNDDGRVRRMSASALPLTTLGTFILWLGWYGFNGGSIGSLSTLEDAVRLSQIYVNTTMGAAGGILAAIILMQLFGGKIDVRHALNGALAGLVSITASPETAEPWLALFIGAVGGIIVVLTTPMLDRFRIDDVVGAVPVHLFAGIWGTLAVCLSHSQADPLVQLTGIAAIGSFAACTSYLVWWIIRLTIGLRLSKAEEVLGLDRIELGTPAYPEFRLND
ncbi:MAG: ammonium transporter [Methyloligellaceae bacterium]